MVWIRMWPPVVAALALLAGCGSSNAPATGVESESTLPSTPIVDQAPTTPDDGLQADDGRSLWAPPTYGEPIDLSVVPDSSGLVLWLRPAELLASEEGRRVWRALGPFGESARQAIESAAGKALAEIDSLALGVTAGTSYDTVTTDLRVEPTPSDELPLLQREVEQLLDTTDADRLATLVFSPRFVLGDGGALLTGAAAPLRDLLLAHARDEWAAVALSLHLDRQARLYWELRVIGDASLPEARTAADVARRAGAWSEELRGMVTDAVWSDYSSAVVGRSPAMLAVLARYARRGVDGRQAVVNGYLPPGAAHNLLLAGERVVAEIGQPASAAVVSATEPEPTTLAQRLQKPVSIRFARESLETAVGILADALGAPIEILGRDLQLDGITRNQMLALDVTDKPAAEALVEVLRRANPDTLAESADDTRQKLVYVIRDNGLVITTRTAAGRRGDTLPTAFLPQDR